MIDNHQITRHKTIFYYAKYLRKSSEEEASRSIRNQNDVLNNELQKLIKSDSYNEYHYIDTYCDEDYTGTDSNRPDFKRLLKDISSKKVNMIIVTDLSRLSRNIAESINYVQVLFVALNIRFISAQLPTLDSYLQPDKVYSLEIPMQSMMNENHAAETSFKVRRTFNNARQNGKFIGAFAGYGWKKDPNDKHRLLLDDEPVDVLHQIRDWLFNGDSIGMIQRKLNAQGILSPAGYKIKMGMKFQPGCSTPTYLWSTQMIRRLMLRPENIGDLIQGRYKVVSYKIHKQIMTPESEWFICKGAIPPIFNKEEQQQINAILNKNTRVSPSNKAKQVYLFSGFLKCADCGKSMARKTSKGIIYYNCSLYKRYGNKACSKHTIRHDKLEAAILAVLQRQIRMTADIENVIETVNKTPLIPKDQKNLETKIKDCKKELQKVFTYKKNLYEDWKNNDISRTEYHLLKSQYTEKEDRLNKIIIELEKKKNNSLQSINKETSVIYNFIYNKNLSNLSRDILTDLIKYIAIHENGDLTIYFNFSCHT